MTTQLIFNLERQAELRDTHYGWLRDFCASNADLSEIVGGIDFAGWEEANSPETNRDFLQRCQEDNRTKKPFKLLYHVGESFSQLSLASAVRWIFTLADLGLPRLGHCLALGYNPELLGGQIRFERRDEFLAHQRWLQSDKAELLHSYGYRNTVSPRFGDDPGLEAIRIAYTPEYQADCQSLQLAVAAFMRDQRTAIEVCPTSNRRIGGIVENGDHPLWFFRQQGISLLCGTDDPGIFATDWSQEFASFLASPSVPERV